MNKQNYLKIKKLLAKALVRLKKKYTFVTMKKLI